MSGKEDHIIFFCVKSNSEKIEKVFEVFRKRCSDIIGIGVRGFSEQVFEVERNLQDRTCFPINQFIFLQKNIIKGFKHILKPNYDVTLVQNRL